MPVELRGARRALCLSQSWPGTEQAISLNGSAYADLPVAFKYRKEYVKGCSCKQAEYNPTDIETYNKSAEATAATTPVKGKPGKKGTPAPQTTAPVPQAAPAEAASPAAGAPAADAGPPAQLDLSITGSGAPAAPAPEPQAEAATSASCSCRRASAGPAGAAIDHHQVEDPSPAQPQ